MSLEIRDLELLAELARSGTLAAAAESLHVSQPALSQRLKLMEERLGTPLFLRQGRRLVPNDAGRLLLPQTVRLLRDLAAAEHDVREIARSHGQRVRLASQCSTTFAWLPPVLRELRARHTEARVQIETAPGDDPIPGLLEHSLDIALVTKVDRRADDLALTRLFDDEMVAVAAPGHPWSRRRLIRGADFAGEHVVLYDSYDPARVPATPLPLPPGARPRQVSTVPMLSELLLELVAAGEGVSVLPSWVVAPAVARAEVVAVPMRPRHQRTWYAATRRDEDRPAVTTLLELLQRHLGEHPGEHPGDRHGDGDPARTVGRPHGAALSSAAG